MNYSLQMNKTNIIGPLPVAQPGKPMQPSAHSATSRIKWAVAFEAEPLRQCFALPPPLTRGGLGSRVKLAGYARGSPTRGAGERSETERLDEGEPDREPLLDSTSPSLLRNATARVAAPSVCCAVARILLAAAPTATPCFRRWRRSSPLPLVGEPLARRQSFAECQGLPSVGEVALRSNDGEVILFFAKPPCKPPRDAV